MQRCSDCIFEQKINNFIEIVRIDGIKLFFFFFFFFSATSNLFFVNKTMTVRKHYLGGKNGSNLTSNIFYANSAHNCFFIIYPWQKKIICKVAILLNYWLSRNYLSTFIYFILCTRWNNHRRVLKPFITIMHRWLKWNKNENKRRNNEFVRRVNFIRSIKTKLDSDKISLHSPRVL